MQNARLAPFIAFVAAVSLAAGAAAQVLEIDAGGAVTVHRGPEVFSYNTQSASPLATSNAGPMRDARRSSVLDAIQSAGAKSGLSPQALEAVAWQESRLDPRAISPKGAVGVMQLMPRTAGEMGVDPHNVAANVEGGAGYLARMLNEFHGDLVLALAAYNAGPAAVRRYSGVPPFRQTRAYVDAVLNRLATEAQAEGAP